MFQKLIQGFEAFYSATQTSELINSTMGLDILSAEAQKVFNQSSTNWSSNANDAISSASRSIYPYEITPIIPNESPP
jgi:hypothetical protein